MSRDARLWSAGDARRRNKRLMCAPPVAASWAKQAARRAFCHRLARSSITELAFHGIYTAAGTVWVQSQKCASRRNGCSDELAAVHSVLTA